MNTIQLYSVLTKIVNKKIYSLGVLACDELPTHIVRVPVMVIINTDPTRLPGKHWLAVFITADRHGYFFDSFGNSPTNISFPKTIDVFLNKNCMEISYSTLQVQDKTSTTCGEHCIFFLCNIQKGISYQKVLNMYSSNHACNDIMVCSYVKRIHRGLCRGHIVTCVQYANH